MLQLYTLGPCGRKSSLEKPHSLPQVHVNESYCPSSMPCSTRIHSTKGSKDVFLNYINSWLMLFEQMKTNHS